MFPLVKSELGPRMDEFSSCCSIPASSAFNSLPSYSIGIDAHSMGSVAPDLENIKADMADSDCDCHFSFDGLIDMRFGFQSFVGYFATAEDLISISLPGVEIFKPIESNGGRSRWRFKLDLLFAWPLAVSRFNISMEAKL
ncbi:hypothetical protein LXL04_011427 [Taraxacum kok-saghyz]